MRILVSDPGGTTGWCIMDWDFSSEIRPTLRLVEQTPGSEFPSTLDKVLSDESSGIDLVVFERFRIFKGTVGEQAIPVIEQIGRIKMVCEKHGVKYISQPPANKSFFEKRLAALGMYATGEEHARDAISHALYYYMTHGKKRTGKTPEWVLGILPT